VISEGHLQGGDNSKWGVCHSDELYYFWRPYWYKAVLDNVGFTAAEAEVSSNVLEMWSNFAKTGHPTPSGTPAMWYPVAQDSHNYLVIDTNLEMALTDEYLARMGVWEQTWVETQDNVWQPPSSFKAGKRTKN
jgi:carboxylesterase type B